MLVETSMGGRWSAAFAVVNANVLWSMVGVRASSNENTAPAE